VTRASSGSVFGILIAVAGACSSPPNRGLSEACAANGDCSSNLVCVFGRCHQACDEASDCLAGQGCVIASVQVAVCQLPIEEHCTVADDCSAPLLCAVDQKCRQPCSSTSDCAVGMVCAASGACAEPSEVDANNNLVGSDAG
jgi:hypothetical protein